MSKKHLVICVAAAWLTVQPSVFGVGPSFRPGATFVAFSQPHGTNFGDVDGDGITDFVVGKRYWSHRDTYLDPDPYGPAVLYWYKTVRNPNAPGGAEFVPELIHTAWRMP